MTSEGDIVDKAVPIVDVVSTTTADGAAELEKTGFDWVTTGRRC